MLTPLLSATVDRPCLVLATSDFAYPSETLVRLRRLGWDIYQTEVGPEARRLTRLLEPAVVVLDTDLAEESGWLTCAKLERERPGGEVVLVASEDNAQNRDLAEFVGASALVSRQQSLVAVLQSRRVSTGNGVLAEAA